MSDVSIVHFGDLPIGAVFDQVPPTSPFWGRPFFVKISLTEHTREDHPVPIYDDIDMDDNVWLIEDDLRRAVRLAREQSS